MMRIAGGLLTLFGCAWLFGLVAPSASASGQAVAHRLVAETDTPAPGETVTLAMVMTPNRGWHGYWQNPGDIGALATLKWKLPAGVTTGSPQYPVPERQLRSGMMNYIYNGRYAILADLKLAPTLSPGTELPIAGKLDFLACTDDVCVPQTAAFKTVLHVGKTAGPRHREAQFDEYRRALPLPLGVKAQFAPGKDRFRISVPLPASLTVGNAYFFPVTDGALVYSSPQRIWRDGDRLMIEGEAGRSADTLERVEGVLSIGRQAFSLTATRGPLLAAQPSGTPEWQVALLALGGALLGGLLLNLMPCVFPILSLKALSLGRAAEDRGAARREGLAYTVGSVVTCLALGGMLLGLKSSGAAAGWAFQLQNPWLVLALLVLTIAITLNLAGLFELPSITVGERGTRMQGSAGAFWTGALAGFIATPCTGPFMGAALGAALLLPTAAALAVFGGLGLGLALPFLLLGYVPALRRLLPRPGAWMARFRRLLAIPMGLSAIWLGWVLVQEVRPSAPTEQVSANEMGATPFSEVRLNALRAERRPVFVYITADWCITCKVNERVALNRRDVVSAFANHGVAVLAGDWTNGDPAITRFLALHGRAGVPLYVWYAPGRPPRLLPQILTPSLLTNLTKENDHV